MFEITIPIVLQILQTAGILVGIFYYVMTLRNTRRNQQITLETRQSQLFMQILDKMWSPGMEEKVLLLDSMLDASDEEWLERYNSDDEFSRAFTVYAYAWEALGTLLKAGMYDVELLALYYATGTIYEWERYRDIVHNWRLINKRSYDMWEYAYDALKRYLEEHPELAPGPNP